MNDAIANRLVDTFREIRRAIEDLDDTLEVLIEKLKDDEKEQATKEFSTNGENNSH